MIKQAKLYSIIEVGPQSLVVLEDVAGPQLLPIWIGPAEGNAIESAVLGEEPPRPMTHDLLLQTIERLGGTVGAVTITKVENGTFFAEIRVDAGIRSVAIDARPSDSIALSVRAKCPLYVDDRVFESVPKLLKPISDHEVAEFREQLATMTPADFVRGLRPD